MRKDKKTERTKEKIIQAFIIEFGINGYDAISINSICNKYNITKGLLYHNYKGKDEIYLICIKQCFKSLVECFKDKVKQDHLNPEEQLKDYFLVRLKFFHEHPYYQRLFCDVMTFPPPHLKVEIEQIKQEFIKLNTDLLTDIISKLNIRKDLSMKEVIEIFRLYQDFLNTNVFYSLQDFNFKEHEEHCYKALNILLYGIVQRNKGGIYNDKNE